MQPGPTTPHRGPSSGGGTSPRAAAKTSASKDQDHPLEAMTCDAAAKGAKVVVWPEETLNYDPRVAHTDWIPAPVRQTGVFLDGLHAQRRGRRRRPNTGSAGEPTGRTSRRCTSRPSGCSSRAREVPARERNNLRSRLRRARSAVRSSASTSTSPTARPARPPRNGRR